MGHGGGGGGGGACEQKQTRSFTVDNCDFKGKILADTFHGTGRCGVEMIEERGSQVLGTGGLGVGVGRVALWDWADLQETPKVFLTCSGSRGQRKPSLLLSVCVLNVTCCIFAVSLGWVSTRKVIIVARLV